MEFTISSPNGIGGSLGKCTALIETRMPCLIGNYRTVTRLSVAGDILRALWPKVAYWLILAVAAVGTLICVRSG